MLDNNIITLVDFQRMKERFKPNRLEIVGIVCKPSFELLIRTKIIEQSHSPFSNGALVGVDVYTDVDQQADILAFSDRNLLSAYLNRKNEPRKWIEVFLRDQIGAEGFDKLFPEGMP